MDFDLAKAADGHALAVKPYRAEGTPWAAMLIAGAMGVRQDFYGAVARFFAGNGVDVAKVDAVIGVTAGSGWYRHNDRMPLRVRFFWHVAVPLLTPLFGYFPGKAIRMVGDLPKGVALQWRRWCLHPDYLLSEGEASRAAYARFSACSAGPLWEESLGWLRARLA